MTKKAPSAPRTAAVVGPYLSGKTTLLESILFATGKVPRKGTAKEGNTVGDGSPEARARQMTTELNVVNTEYLDDKWTFIDCPGSIELAQEAHNGLIVADAAVVVCEPDLHKAMTVGPLLRRLDEHQIPHILFINKMDTAQVGVKEVLEALQAVSSRPLVLREIPIRDGDKITGHVDLVSERAFRWNANKPSDLIQIPDSVTQLEKSARTEMLESLADFDDKLLEALLEDSVPSTDDIYRNLTKDLQQNLIVPVFFGSALHDNGIRRLLKALRHEAPEPAVTAARLKIDVKGAGPVARVFKTLHAGHSGKLSYARIWRGEITDGTTLGGRRVSGLYHTLGQKHDKTPKALAGDVVALGRLEDVKTGDLLGAENGAAAGVWSRVLKPLFSLAIHAEQRADEVKLSGVLAKLVDEDPSLSYETSQDTGELLLWGQGEIHLLIALDRLRNRFHLSVKSQRPQVPYKETIRKPVSQHARHKKQSGGHGQFGDVHIDIKPLPRGSGFVFGNSVTGGAVPKQYIPAVEAGVLEYLARGPLGFRVVDLSVTLTDGQYHTVDSSEMAFKQAAMMAMREGMPGCNPILLEPIFHVDISVPNDFTSKIQRLVSGRRGHILGFTAKDGWAGWDQVSVQLPQSEMHDLIVELRSITQGVGTFEWRFDHLQEFAGKLADQVVSQRQQAHTPH
ncbi:MAG: elongation factor G [Rhodospirillales bacterium]|nr:elongation factor G [Rhodospirillales bacterium]